LGPTSKELGEEKKTKGEERTEGQGGKESASEEEEMREDGDESVRPSVTLESNA